MHIQTVNMNVIFSIRLVEDQMWELDISIQCWYLISIDIQLIVNVFF